MSEREEVLSEFGSAWRTTATDAMADEIVRLRSQLDEYQRTEGAWEAACLVAERERDEAREQLRLANLDWANCAAAAADHRAEADALRHRAEADALRYRAERMAIEHTDSLDAYRQMYESERDRAERSEHRVRDIARDVLTAMASEEVRPGPAGLLCVLHTQMKALDATRTGEAL